MNPTRARDLVLRHGWHPSAYQILNPGIAHWFSAAGDAVVGYRDYGDVRIAAGEPVCADSRLGAVVAEFEAGARGLRICYLAAEQRLADCLAGSGYASAVIGAHPILDPASWPATLASRASLRAQLHRARNKGVTVEAWPATTARDHPALESCLAEWLAARSLPPLHFLVEPQTLSLLDDRRTFVARHGEHVVAFLVASPIPLRRGWLIEQIARRPDAPNGTAELLVDAALRTLHADGYSHVALGVAPLSRRAGPTGAAPFAGLVLGWVRAHSRRFYNVTGLEAFKAKFQPARWEPVYVLSREPALSLGTLWSIGGVYCGRSPLATGLTAGWSAIRQEVRWMFGLAKRRRAAAGPAVSGAPGARARPGTRAHRTPPR